MPACPTLFDIFANGPTSRLTSISRKSELFSERVPHRRHVVAYVCVPSNYDYARENGATGSYRDSTIT